MADTQSNAPETVTVTIDGKPITVAKGTNIIEAARLAGVEIPYYCYHKHLSIAGNCRMCQVQIKGRPKLEIGCNTSVADGMDIATHHSSKEVRAAQAAILEFILINHPLDCTVCDQAGHCKLQDYHYEYNARPSRFIEKKEHKVKAEPLGPTVMLDGERCIMCTRCIRFCDEITKTSELGMSNRGDKSVIVIDPSQPLNNPLSGTVVDLCPVGALTHTKWRFNTRMWYAKSTDTICPGCSTGCNVRVFVRDREVVQVKARLNSLVNKEWLCDEGRYGFMRFLPRSRVTGVTLEGRATSIDEGIKYLKGFSTGDTIIFAGADCSTEVFFLLKKLIDSTLKNARLVISYKERSLTDVEAILISPDYAPNFKGAQCAGVVSGDLQASYYQALKELAQGRFANVFVLGDRGILPEECSHEVVNAISVARVSAGVLTDANHSVIGALKLVIGGRSILEQSGTMTNRAGIVQKVQRVIDPPEPTFPLWRVINSLAQSFGTVLVKGNTDRDAMVWLQGVGT